MPQAKGTPRGAHGPNSKGQPPPAGPSGARTPVVRVDGMVLAPARCGMCGYGENDRGVVDVGLSFRFYGRLYLCGTCVAQVASMFGLVASGEADAVRVDLAAALERIVALEQELSGLERFKALASEVSA